MPSPLTPRECDEKGHASAENTAAATCAGSLSMALIPPRRPAWAHRVAADTLLMNSAPPRATQPFQEVIKNRAPFRT